MALVTFPSDLQVIGNISSQTISLPPASVGDSAVRTPSPASAGIAATKVLHLVEKQVSQVPGTAVAAATNLVHVVYGTSCTIQGVQVICITHPTGSDTVTVDVKKAPSGSTTFTSILSSTIGLSSTTVNNTVVSGTLSTTTASQGDTFEVVVTVSGTSCQGLLVSLILAESAF